MKSQGIWIWILSGNPDADDLMISTESMSIEELLVKLKTLKSEMAKKG